MRLTLMPLLLCLCAVLRAEEAPLRVDFYFTPGCPKCEGTKEAVAAAEKRFGSRIEVLRHDLSAGEETFRAYVARLDEHKVRKTPNLAVFAADACLAGEDQIVPLLESTLEKLLADRPEKSPPATAPPQSAPAASSRLDFGMVSLAALADGINPCAFATVILFVSMLCAVGRSRREILLVGLSFVVAVFLTYLAIGLCFFQAMALLKHVTFLTVALKIVALAGLLIAGILSLVDAVRAWRTDGKAQMLLVLPVWLKNRIRQRLSGTARGASLASSAFGAGIVVSFLESACTGQVYFPLILGLVQRRDTLWQGMGVLLWYNLLFILPLLCVFGLAVAGVSSERIASAARRSVWATKLALAIAFLGMAAWLLA